MNIVTSYLNMRALVATEHQGVSMWVVELMTAFLVFVGLHQYFAQILGIRTFLSLYLIALIVLGVLFLRVLFTQLAFAGVS